MNLPIELGFGAAGDTGWGLIGLHMALGFARQGRKVYLPSQATDPRAIAPTLLPTLAKMLDAGDTKERRIRIDAWGNHWPPFVEIPNRYRVVFAVFEDTAIPDSAIETLRRYDLVLAPSRWIRNILASKGIAAKIWHQGYDSYLFHPAPRRRPDGPVYVFSGGKLEFRKGQDIVIDAFRRFRETPEGEGAVLVTAWQNKWPQTMVSIWESGYVRGVPVMRGPTLDMTAWAEANGVPRDAFIDLGFLNQADMANAVRECDVAIFPNRCEGATNITLIETMGCGVPVLAARATGQADVPVCDGLMVDQPVTLPCPLFKGMEGWVEPDPVDCAQRLSDLVRYANLSTPSVVPHSWTWQGAMTELEHMLPDA